MDPGRPNAGRIPDTVFAAAWMVLGILVVLAARGMRDPAGHFPTLVGGLMAVVAFIRLIRGWTTTPFVLADIQRPDAFRGIAFLASIGVLWLLVLLVGLTIGGVLWALVVFLAIYRWRLRRSLIYAVALVLIISIIFPLLGLDLPTGILRP